MQFESISGLKIYLERTEIFQVDSMPSLVLGCKVGSYN